MENPLNGARRVMTDSLPQDRKIIDVLRSNGNDDSEEPFVGFTVKKGSAKTYTRQSWFSAIENGLLTVMDQCGVSSISIDFVGLQFASAPMEKLRVEDFLDVQFFTRSEDSEPQAVTSAVRKIVTDIRTTGSSQLEIVSQDQIDGLPFYTMNFGPSEYTELLSKLDGYDVEMIYHGKKRILVVVKPCKI